MSIGIYQGRASDGITTIAQIAVDESPAVKFISAGEKSKLQLKNIGADTVYLGNDDTVTSSTGYPLAAGERIDLDDSAQEWWGICGSGDSTTVATLTGGVQ